MNKSVPKDQAMEDRIDFEIVVDAYNSDEAAMGWYYYLQNHMHFPFQVKASNLRGTSILKPGEIATVVSMADEDECMSEIFVMVEFGEYCFDAPLEQLQPVNASEQTQISIQTWHYWCARGYNYD